MTRPQVSPTSAPSPVPPPAGDRSGSRAATGRTGTAAPAPPRGAAVKTSRSLPFSSEPRRAAAGEMSRTAGPDASRTGKGIPADGTGIPAQAPVGGAPEASVPSAGSKAGGREAY